MTDASKRLTTYAMLGQLYADMGREMVTNGHAGPGDEIASTADWQDDSDECTCGHYYDDHEGGACTFTGCGCGATAWRRG